MPELSAADLISLKEIDREETNPGSGLISEAHCNEMVTLGFADGSFESGYRLTVAGREALANAAE